ncbi:MAG TPA: DUF1778 domain-containing protein [Pyrinomonadaceae bacterium]|nr:DUF1778 domain-containing protein [Pyrinomonadaceae bacterium]
MAVGTLSKTKIDRMHFRLPKAVKDRVEKAALASGQTLTDFAVSVLASSADEVLERQFATTLTDRDRDRLLRLLDADAKPGKALKQAQKLHKKLILE